jgi:FkbM family methyltransferase
VLHLGRLWYSPEYRFLQRLHGLSQRAPRYRPGQTTFDGRIIRYADAASFTSAWDEIFVNRIYDIDEPAGEECYFVDAGSNIGLAVLYWTLRYPRAHGVACEPDPSSCGLLRENVAGWQARFDILETAVGARDGIASFAVEGGDAGHLAEAPAAAGTLQVAVRRLSPLLDRPVSLLKIDIEGAEYEVLEEICGSFGNVRRIFVECHSYPDRPQHYGARLQLLREAGFRCQAHATSQHPQPFHPPAIRAAKMDFSLNVFGTRF